MKKVKHFFKTLKFRVLFWYLLTFSLSSIIIFSLSYYFLYNSLLNKEKKELVVMLNQYITFYQTKNIEILKKRISLPQIKYNYFAEIKDKGKLIIKNLPKKWSDKFFNENRLPYTKNIKIVKVRSNDDPDDFFYVAYFKDKNKFFAIGEMFEETDDLLENFFDISIIIILLILIIGATGGYIITTKLVSPINNVIVTMNEIANTRNFALRMKKDKKVAYELNQLIDIFNIMLERIEKLIDGMKDSLDYVAHDLKTPITRLKNSAYSILSKKDSNINECREALIKTIEECDEIVKMLDSIMTLSEAETGSVKLNFDTIDLKEIINEIVELYEFIAEEKNIKIIKHFQGNCKVKGDRHLLGRAISNLIDNAIKYSNENSEIICSVIDEGKYVKIEVKDYGIGIDQAEINKIFERLYRGDKSRLTKGHGLGLSLVKAIVELHNGKLSVKSKKNKGSTFIIQLEK